MAFWGNTDGIILDDNGVVDCETCPCETVVCCNANVPRILTLTLNGTPANGTCSSGCDSLDATSRTVGWIGEPYCSWDDAVEFGGDGGSPIGGCQSGASLGTISETECEIFAHFGAFAVCDEYPEGRCVGADYRLVVPIGTDPPWVLPYETGTTSLECDFSGTTLTVG